jgi:hypothetical protein
MSGRIAGAGASEKEQASMRPALSINQKFVFLISSSATNRAAFASVPQTKRKEDT